MASPQLLDNISELSAVLKTVFGDRLQQQQNMAAMIYKKFSASETRFGGNSYEFPARMVNTQSVGARGYRQSLPEPILNTDVTSRVRHKFIYGTGDIAGPDIEKGKGNVNAFVNTLTDKMSSITEATIKDLNQQCYLDGTAVRSQGSAAAWTNGVTAIVTTGAYGYGVKYLRVGMHVNVVATSDGATIRVGGESDAVDTSGIYQNARYTVISLTGGASPSVTLGKGNPPAGSTVTAATTNDMIVRHKTIGAELTGLTAIVDDGVNNTGANILQDIDRTSSPLWRAKVLNANGDLTLTLMQLAIDIPEMISGRRINTIVGGYNARDQYLKLLVPQKRFGDLKLDGGFQTLEYNGRDFLVDVDCPETQIFFLNTDSIKKFGLFDLQFVEQTGGILKHDSLGAGDVFYFFMRAICNLGTVQANANSKIVGITLDTNYLITY